MYQIHVYFVCVLIYYMIHADTIFKMKIRVFLQVQLVKLATHVLCLRCLYSTDGIYVFGVCW